MTFTLVSPLHCESFSSRACSCADIYHRTANSFKPPAAVPRERRRLGLVLPNFAEFLLNFVQILAKFFRDFSKMQHFLKRYGEVRNFKKVRKFASSNLKFRSSKFKFTEILICNPGYAYAWGVGGRFSNGLHKQSSQIDNQILADLWFEIRAHR